MLMTAPQLRAEACAVLLSLVVKRLPASELSCLDADPAAYCEVDRVCADRRSDPTSVQSCLHAEAQSSSLCEVGRLGNIPPLAEFAGC